MKITTYISVAAMMAMLAANTSCTKEETIAPEENKHIVTLNVSTETLSRIGLTDDATEGVKVEWEKGDVLEVWARPDGTTSDKWGTLSKYGISVSEFTLATGDGSKNATFTGTIDTDPEYLNVVYRKNILGGNLEQNNNTLDFRCISYPQLLTTDINEAPMVLAGVFQRQTDGTYSPVGGKMIYAGALFKMNIEGLATNQNISQIAFTAITDGKYVGNGAHINLVDGVPTVVGGQGIPKPNSGILKVDGNTVQTDGQGKVTVYTCIMGKNAQNGLGTQTSDYKVDVYMEGGAVYTSTLKMATAKIDYSKCYQVDLKVESVPAE